MGLLVRKKRERRRDRLEGKQPGERNRKKMEKSRVGKRRRETKIRETKEERDRASTTAFRYKVEHHHSSPYRPQANGSVEAANKEIKRILSKMCERYKSWAEKLPFTLWGPRTTFKSVNGASPFELEYGMEAVLLIELEKKSLRVFVEAGLIEEEWVKKRYEDLVLLDGTRLNARFLLHFYGLLFEFHEL
ncbi:uncharacterized protein LOC119370940 [Jatropha curcas]|uniref:uncharacterized protein LOC119370940 n=1 Tax=Jatropha curcas TaxID=180498 RepID=UPI00189460D4|nr:uncharacterized protein LOC119370940 [Jatropha curcas]